MTLDNTQQKVRQRARFLCENPDCRKPTLCEYAHIIPDSWGGEYTVDNILFLCGDCHPKFDYSVFRRDPDLALEYLRMMKNVRKDNAHIEHLFYFLSHKIIVKIDSGITLENCKIMYKEAPSNARDKRTTIMFSKVMLALICGIKDFSF